MGWEREEDNVGEADEPQSFAAVLGGEGSGRRVRLSLFCFWWTPEALSCRCALNPQGYDLFIVEAVGCLRGE